MYYHRNENCIVYLKLNWIKVEVTVDSEMFCMYNLVEMLSFKFRSVIFNSHKE